MFNRKTLLGATLAVLASTTALAPGIYADEATYIAYWDGQPFLELENPLARFDWVPVEDDDGDGIANLSSLPDPPDFPPQWRNFSHLTNTDIEAAMLKVGVSKDDIVAQINALMSWNASLDDTREQAIEAVQNGLYLQAASIMTGTIADVHYFCGDYYGPQTYDWVLAIPTLISCEAGNDIPELAVVTSPYLVVPCVVAVDRIAMQLIGAPMNPLDERSFVYGVGYLNHNAGMLASIQNGYVGSVDLDGLCSPFKDATVALASSVGSGLLQKDDEYIYTYGDPNNWQEVLTLGKSYALVMRHGTDLTLDLDVYSDSDQLNIDFRLVDTPSNAFEKLKIDLRVDDGGRVQAEACHPVQDWVGCQFPPPGGRTYSLDYKKVFTSAEQGVKHQVAVDGWSSGQLKDVEVWGTFRKGTGTDLDFAIKGLPDGAAMRLDNGKTNDELGIASYDLTRLGNNNYFRSVVVDGKADELALQVTGTDVIRGRMAAGKNDPFDGDEDKHVELSARFMSERGALHAKAKQNFFIGYEGLLNVENWDFGVNRWHIDVFCGIWCDSDVLPLGHTVKWDSAALNGYFWSVNAIQEGFSECPPAWMIDGQCI